MLKHIIVPFEDRDSSASLAPAIEIANTLNLSLTLIYLHKHLEAPVTLESLPLYRLHGAIEAWDAHDRFQETAATEFLRSQARQLQAAFPNLEVDILPVGPSLYSDLSRERHEALVVYQTPLPRHTPLPNPLQFLLARTGLPLLLVDEGKSFSLAHECLVPLDGTRLSEDALPLCVDVAQKLKAHVNLMTCIVSSQNSARFSSAPIHTKEKAEQYLSRLQMTLETQKVLADSKVLLSDSPGSAIGCEACAADADVIILATHGSDSVQHMVMGRVAEELLMTTTTPLLLISPEPEAKTLSEFYEQLESVETEGDMTVYPAA